MWRIDLAELAAFALLLDSSPSAIKLRPCQQVIIIIFVLPGYFAVCQVL
jgi:hypothetical protein